VGDLFTCTGSSRVEGDQSPMGDGKDCGMKFLRFIQTVFVSPVYAADESCLQAWRERVLSANLFVIVSMGTVGYVIFLISDILRGFQDSSYWAEIPFNTIGYLIILGIAFGRRLPFAWRAGGLLLALSAIALSDKLQAGLSGIGELLLLTASTLLVVFFGWKGGVAAVGLDIALMAIPGWLMTTGRFELPSLERINTSGEPTAWLITTLALIVLSLMIVVSVGVLVQGLNTCLPQRSDSES
jgi:hypothetical protein